MEKKKYIAPTLQVLFVELEQGIASTSATLTPGSTPNPYQPHVENWTDESETEQGYL